MIRSISLEFLNTAPIPAKNADAYGPEVAAGLGSFFFQGECYWMFVNQSGLGYAVGNALLTN